MPLIKVFATLQDWNVFRQAVKYVGKDALPEQYSLFWLKIATMVSNVNSPQENKDIISEPTDNTPTKDDVLSGLVQICVTIGNNSFSTPMHH